MCERGKRTTYYYPARKYCCTFFTVSYFYNPDSLSVKEEILNLPLFPNVYEYDTQECVNAANGQHIIILGYKAALLIYRYGMYGPLGLAGHTPLSCMDSLPLTSL
jgi:hypothetical protein